jgi:dipeptidyl aminopeptidase/acylaminoacyl peptidase
MLRTAVAALCVLAAAHAAAGPVTFDDIMEIRRVSDAVMSPDGRTVLYAIRQWESAADEPGKKEQRSQIWRVSVAGGDSTARPLTFDVAGASSPAWSPDGRYISFISGRGGQEARPQVWIMRADGGEAEKLTGVKEGVSSYAWSPDGTRVAFVSRDPEPEDAAERRKRGDDRRLFEDEFRMSHVSVIDRESRKTAAVTEGSAFTVRGGLSWSPDGARLAFAAAPTTMLRDDRQDIYIAAVNDKRVERITPNAGSDASPRWSPDGRMIAFLTEPPSTFKPGADGIATASPRQSRLAFYDVRSRAITEASFELEPRILAWTPDSAQLLVGVGRGTFNEVFSYGMASKRFTPLTSGRMIAFGSLSKDGAAAAFVMESAAQPPDVYTSDASFASPRRLTTANPQAAGFSLGDTEVITWKNEGFDIEGVLLKPVGYRPGMKYPLLVVVHGGPAGAHMNGYRVAYGDGGQHWAGQGWAVLYPNPRGGTNYGERFLRANIPDWGGGDFRDIMAGVDAAIAKGIADPDRLAIQGWSYGGYMTSWAVTQTARFKAAMVGAGITNLWSMYGTNDLPNYLAAFFGGIPSKETLPLYMERSAMTHAHKAVTPTLILHGGSDERVPIGQPMEFYRALKERGTPTELVFYPRQGHGLQDYFHQLDRLRRQFAWITRYTLGDEGRKTTTQ